MASVLAANSGLAVRLLSVKFLALHQTVWSVEATLCRPDTSLAHARKGEQVLNLSLPRQRALPASRIAERDELHLRGTYASDTLQPHSDRPSWALHTETPSLHDHSLAGGGSSAHLLGAKLCELCCAVWRDLGQVVAHADGAVWQPARAPVRCLKNGAQRLCPAPLNARPYPSACINHLSAQTVLIMTSKKFP